MYTHTHIHMRDMNRRRDTQRVRSQVENIGAFRVNQRPDLIVPSGIPFINLFRYNDTEFRRAFCGRVCTMRLSIFVCAV